jgi:two-component system chemotaxis sensor kinase CheA
MHLVRHAMAHGVESTEHRLAAGKTARARVRLHAYHDSGSIVIAVSDDGGGLNTEEIRTKAIERGLPGASATPSTQKINQLSLEPGLSTADAVSNLSGRGVGMDVLFRAVATDAGLNALGIMMTGMGDDGAAGLREVQEVGRMSVGLQHSINTSINMTVRRCEEE